MSPVKEGTKFQDFRNPNLIKNLHLGQKETLNGVNDRFSTMSSSYYSTFYSKANGTNTIQSPIDKFQKTQKEMKSELLQHGFELGYDVNGGPKRLTNNQ